MNPYFQLAQYILPGELFSHFELCSVEELDSELHLYLEEKNCPPDSDVPLQPNGFHEESCIWDQRYIKNGDSYVNSSFFRKFVQTSFK